jgi:hypothetical protein
MYTFDESAFPIVSLTSQGQPTLEDAEVYTSTMDRILARQENFAILMFDENGEDANRDNRVTNAIVKWQKEARSKITQYCAGVAGLTSSRDFYARYAPMMAERGEQIYGAPAHLFMAEEVAAARQWLTERLAAKASPTS